jgi:hypothetical protein
MTVRIETRNGKLRYDIRTWDANGAVRERHNFPAVLKTDAARQRWAHEREMVLTREGRARKADGPPTLEVFGPRWMQEYAKANGNKPATIDAKERILRLHLYPALGSYRLDEIDVPAVQKLKLRIAAKAPKTRHNILGQLATLLGTAKEWKLVAEVPKIDLPKLADPEMSFYDFPEWERLVAGARKAGPMHLALVLLGGEAGLRRGELVALEQTDLWGGDGDRPAQRVERDRRHAEGRQPADDPHDAATRGGGEGNPPSRQAGVRAGKGEGREGDDAAVVARGLLPPLGAAHLPRLAPATSHLLLAPRASRTPREGDSGACWARRPEHDDALHAPRAGVEGRRDRGASAGTRRGSRCSDRAILRERPHRDSNSDRRLSARRVYERNDLHRTAQVGTRYVEVRGPGGDQATGSGAAPTDFE